MPNTLAWADPLAPIIGTLAAVRAEQGEARVEGVTPGLLAPDDGRWMPATRLADGSALPELLDAAVRRWHAPRHVAAALAWKQYTYWLLLPAVLGYAVARRVPVMSAGNVLVQQQDGPALVRLGLASPRVLDADLLAGFRRTVLDEHLEPMAAQLGGLVQVGRRTLLGSVASAVCHILVRAQHWLPGGAQPEPGLGGGEHRPHHRGAQPEPGLGGGEHRPHPPYDVRLDAAALLDALDVADLVELTPDLRIRRHTCCLAFALPDPKICAGCCIRP